jgi:hypothetical protein
MNTENNRNYEPPKVEVTRVVTERTIAQSNNFTGTIEDWKKDETPNNQYDGDIWVNF